MAKFFKNRTADDWVAVLKGLGFKLTTDDGDDHGYTHPNGKDNIVVWVPQRNETLITPTSMDMARKACIAAGITKKDILKWWKKNGHGE